MKNILKTILILVLIFSGSQLKAQTYRIEAGYIQPTRYSSVMSNRLFNGIRLGGTVDFNLPAEFLTIHTGLLYTYAFSTSTQKALAGDSAIYKTQGHYIDVPLHLTASHWILKKQVKLFAFAGPNFNIGLSQPQNVTTSANYESVMGVEPGYSDLFKNDIQRFNFQLEAGGGIQWRHFLVKGGYTFGINNLNRKNSDNKLHQSGWYVTAGYEF